MYQLWRSGSLWRMGNIRLLIKRGNDMNYNRFENGVDYKYVEDEELAKAIRL